MANGHKNLSKINLKGKINNVWLCYRYFCDKILREFDFGDGFLIYVFLFLATTFSAMITIGGKLFNNRTKDLTYVSQFYNLLYSLFASLGWLISWLFGFSFNVKVLPYSFLYGICYFAFTVGMLGAIKTGMTSLTALIKQLSLVGVSFWGFAFWGTKVTSLGIIGIILIFLSLCFCLIKKNDKKENSNTLKWLFYALLITVGNAGCSIIQRYQQTAFNYQHKNMFMFFGVFFAMIFCLGFALKEEKYCWKDAFKTAWCFPGLAGFSSVFSNIFILLMIKFQLSPVIIYPTIAVGGLMLTVIISLIFFKEKLSPLQWCGMAVGSVALVLLNL